MVGRSQPIGLEPDDEAAAQFVAHAHEWMAILGPEHRIEWVNAAWAGGLGLCPESMRQGSILDLVQPTDEARLVQALDGAGPAPAEISFALVPAHGDPLTFDWRIWRSDRRVFLSGQPAGSTPLPDALAATFAQAPVGILHVDNTGRIIRANPKADELLGYTEAELQHMTFRDFTLPEDQPLYDAMYQQLAAAGVGTGEMDRQHRRKDGTLIWLHMTGRLIHDASGLMAYAIITLEDASPRKAMEAALQQSQLRFQTMTDHANDLEYWLRPDQTFEYISPSVERITGYTPAEFEADPQLLSAIVVPEDRAMFLDHLAFERTGLAGTTLEFRIQHRSGHIRWIEHLCQPIMREGRYIGRRATSRDITQRKLLEAELDQQRRLLDHIYRTAPGFLYLLDLATDELLTTDSPRAAYRSVVPHPTNIQEALSMMHPADIAAMPAFRAQQKAAPDGEVMVTQFRVKAQDGSWRWIRTRELVVQRSPDGSPRQLFGIAFDATVEVEQTAQLRQSEHRFRQMFERHQAIKLLIDPTTGQIVDANPAAAKFYGWDLPTLRSMRIMDINTLPEAEVRAKMELAKTQQCDFFSFRHRLASGEIRDVEDHSAPIDGDDGSPLLFSIIFDVTNLKQTQRALQSAHQRFEAFMRHGPLAAFIKDREGQIIYVNPACAALFEIEAAQSPDPADRHFWQTDPARKATVKDGAVITEKQLVVGDEIHTWLMHTFPIQDDDSDALMGGVALDITEHKRAEQQLMWAALEHERMLILQHFIEKASHEFRTPLTIIELSIFALANSLSPERQAEVFRRMENQIFHLIRLVDLMELLTRLDTITHLPRAEVCVQRMLQATTQDFSRAFPNRTTDLALHMPDALVWVDGDDTLLRHAVQELLSNAASFSDAGAPIRVELQAVDHEAQISIRDAGTGIAPEYLPQVFERFFRLDHEHTTRGFGLGLPIVRRIAELHQGSVEIDSTPSVGSVARLRLPLARKPSVSATSNPPT